MKNATYVTSLIRNRAKLGELGELRGINGRWTGHLRLGTPAAAAPNIKARS